LFPISYSANTQHSVGIESWVKKQVNDEKNWVWYEVDIDNIRIFKKNGKVVVSSILHAKAGLLNALGHRTPLVTMVNIDSVPRVAPRKAVSLATKGKIKAHNARKSVSLATKRKIMARNDLVFRYIRRNNLDGSKIRFIFLKNPKIKPRKSVSPDYICDLSVGADLVARLYKNKNKRRF
jgi:superfamily I DNA and RNA helicase